MAEITDVSGEASSSKKSVNFTIRTPCYTQKTLQRMDGKVNNHLSKDETPR